MGLFWLDSSHPRDLPPTSLQLCLDLQCSHPSFNICQPGLFPFATQTFQHHAGYNLVSQVCRNKCRVTTKAIICWRNLLPC